MESNNNNAKAQGAELSKKVVEKVMYEPIDSFNGISLDGISGFVRRNKYVLWEKTIGMLNGIVKFNGKSYLLEEDYGFSLYIDYMTTGNKLLSTKITDVISKTDWSDNDEGFLAMEKIQSIVTGEKWYIKTYQLGNKPGNYTKDIMDVCNLLNSLIYVTTMVISDDTLDALEVFAKEIGMSSKKDCLKEMILTDEFIDKWATSSFMEHIEGVDPVKVHSTVVEYVNRVVEHVYDFDMILYK